MHISPITGGSKKNMLLSLVTSAPRARNAWVRVLIGLVATGLPTVVLGQAQDGELNGRVVDPDALALPGVTITLTEQGTGYTRATVTQADGAYIMIKPATRNL